MEQPDKERSLRDDVATFSKEMGRETWLVFVAFMGSLGREAYQVYREQTGVPAASVAGYFWAVTLLLVLHTAFRLWRRNRLRYEAAVDRITALNAELTTLKTPKLVVTHDPESRACRTPSQMRTKTSNAVILFETIFHRVIVTANCRGSIEGCCGRITKIRYGDESIMEHETIVVTFAPGDPSQAATRTNKEIVDKASEMLDIVYISETGIIAPCAPDFRLPSAIGADLPKMFKRHGDYFFNVVISGHGTPSVEIVLKLKWFGDWQAARMELVSQS